MRACELFRETAGEWGDEHPSEQDDWVGLFTEGYCHALAIAVHGLTGLPIVSLMIFRGRQRFIAHVMNEVDADDYLDVRGVRSLIEILEETEYDPDTDDFAVEYAKPKNFTKSRRFARITPEIATLAYEVAMRLIRHENISTV